MEPPIPMQHKRDFIRTAGCVQETKLYYHNVPSFVFNHDIHFSRMVFCESLLQQGRCGGDARLGYNVYSS